MFYSVRSYGPARGIVTTASEKTWLRLLGAMNEYQARLLVAERATKFSRGGVSRLSRLTGMSRVTITQGLTALRGGKLRPSVEGHPKARWRPKACGAGE